MNLEDKTNESIIKTPTTLNEYFTFLESNTHPFDRDEARDWLFEYGAEWYDHDSTSPTQRGAYIVGRMLHKLEEIYQVTRQVRKEYLRSKFNLVWPKKNKIPTIVENEYRGKYKNLPEIVRRLEDER